MSSKYRGSGEKKIDLLGKITRGDMNFTALDTWAKKRKAGAAEEGLAGTRKSGGNVLKSPATSEWGNFS